MIVKKSLLSPFHFPFCGIKWIKVNIRLILVRGTSTAKATVDEDSVCALHIMLPNHLLVALLITSFSSTSAKNISKALSEDII